MIHTPDSAPCEAKPCGRISQKASNFRVLHHRPLGQLSILNFFKHRLARPSDKCKISMQDKREKFRYTPRIQPRVKPNPADESARKPQTFECGPAGRLFTSPCSLACEQANSYYSRFGGPRQRETRHKTAGKEAPTNRAATGHILRLRAHPPFVPGRGQGSRRLFSWGFRDAACFYAARQPFAAGGTLPSARSCRVTLPR